MKCGFFLVETVIKSLQIMQANQKITAVSSEQPPVAISDLELFKMLLQPHFLFNSLNNLYALSVMRSEQTSDAIAGLSDLLSRVVSCSRRDFVTVDEEVELIRQYIELEKIWLGENSFLLHFSVSGDTGNFRVPPMVLYTFVENCFKHGIRKCHGDGWLAINIEVCGGSLSFSAKNRVPGMAGMMFDESGGRSGLGIEAARSLLEQKCTGRYYLTTGRKGSVYSVNLQISCPDSALHK
jgi:LytS/YehU family sensor histidine kinase